MAGTIIATTLGDGTGTVPTTTVIAGAAKAWVNFNGTGTVAIRDDFNVTSITDLGTGQYRINFTTTPSTANYCATALADYRSGYGDGMVSTPDATYSTSYITINSRYAASPPGTAFDATVLQAAFFWN